jgi:Ca2+-binding EF-hand superfamily protein
MKKMESSGNLDPAVERLYSTPKWVPKDEKNSADSIVCDLPSTTLRWMKKRRKMESDQKVVLSYNRERQLREMFQSLDYTHQGEIDLSALIEAVDYVQEKTKHMKGMKEFHNLKEVFLDMDENGDGTIDFTEFTNGMTGTTQSAFDRATEYDIERLFRFFVEFGELRQREIALKKLNISLPNQKKNNKLQRGSSRLMTNKSDSKQEANLKSYQQFKVLFGNPVEKPGAPGNTGNLTSLSATSNPINPLSPSPGIAIENRSRLSPMSSKTHLRPTSPNAADPNSPGDALNEKELFARPVSPELLKLTRMEKLLDDFILDNNPNPHDPLVNPQLRGSSRAQSRQNPSNPNVTPAISQSVPHSPQKSQHLNISTSNDIGDESPPMIQGFGSSDSSVFLPAATSIATRLTLASSRASRRNRYPNITFDEAYETKRNEYLEIHEKLKASRREEYEALSKHYNDVLFMEQRAMAEKK